MPREVDRRIGWQPGPRQLEERVLRVEATSERAEHFTLTKTTLFFRPSGWTPDREWPLLVALPGTGGNVLDWSEYPRFLELADRHRFVVVIPATFGVGRGQDRLGLRSALAEYLSMVIETARTELAATGDQWIMGSSAGGAGAWLWALREPDRWAGWVALAPAGVPSSEELEELGRQRIMVVQGMADTAVYVPATRRLVRELVEQRLASCSVLIEHAGHTLHDWPVMAMVFGFIVDDRCPGIRGGPADGRPSS